MRFKRLAIAVDVGRRMVAFVMMAAMTALLSMMMCNPTIAFAYTVKHDGLESIGHPDYVMTELPNVKDNPYDITVTGTQLSKSDVVLGGGDTWHYFVTLNASGPGDDTAHAYDGTWTVRIANAYEDESGAKYDMLVSSSNIKVGASKAFTPGMITLAAIDVKSDNSHYQLWCQSLFSADKTFAGDNNGAFVQQDITTKIVKHGTDTAVNGGFPVVIEDLDIGRYNHPGDFAPDGTSTADLEKNYPFTESVSPASGVKTDIHTETSTTIRTNGTWFWGSKGTDTEEEMRHSAIAYLGDAAGTTFTTRDWGRAGMALLIPFGKYAVTTKVTSGDGTITPTSNVFMHGSKTIDIKPSDGSIITSVKVDDKDVTVTDATHMTEQFDDVMANHKVEASFAKLPSVIVKYVDDSTKKELKQVTQSGMPGTAVGYTTDADTKTFTDMGYKLVSSDYPTNPTFGKMGTTDTYVVTLTPVIETVPPTTTDKTGTPMTPTKPYPNGLTHNDLNHAVKRTIHYVDTNGAKVFDDKSDEAAFTRVAHVNHVTSVVTYDDWTPSSQKLAEVTSPTKDGLTADKASVAESTVSHDSKDIDVTVTYTTDDQRADVTFVDDTTKADITKLTETGKSGAAMTMDVSGKVSELETHGYELVDNGYGNGQTFDTDKTVDQHFTVHMKEIVETITPNTPKTTGDQMNTDGTKYPSGLTESDLRHVTTRVIHYVDDDGNTLFPDNTAKVTFERTATVNHVTGKTSYSAWSVAGTDTLPEVASPEKKGMTASVTKVPSTKATETTDSFEVTVKYAKDAQRAMVRFQDESGKSIANDATAVGKSGDAISIDVKTTIDKLVGDGYELVSNGFPSDAKYDDDKSVDQVFVVKMKPVIETVTYDKPHANTEPMTPSGKKYPQGLTAPDLSDDIERTVSYLYEDGRKAADGVSQDVRYERTATVNHVTSEVSYTDWKQVKSGFDAVTSPEIKNYTADYKEVEKRTPAVGEADSHVTVIYVANGQRAEIRFVDGDGNAIHDSLAEAGKGGTKMTMDPSKTIAEIGTHGWKMTKNDYPVDATFDIDDDKDQTYTVTFEPIIETVKADDPRAPDTQMNDDGTKYPKGLEEGDLRKTTSRTIHYQDEDGRQMSQDKAQSVTFERVAKVNHVTGEVTYGDWTPQSAKFESVVTPTIDGYTPDLDIVSEADVTPGMDDMTVIVRYAKDKEPEKAETPAPKNEEPASPQQPQRQEPQVAQTGDGTIGIVAMGGVIAVAIAVAIMRIRHVVR